MRAPQNRSKISDLQTQLKAGGEDGSVFLLGTPIFPNGRITPAGSQIDAREHHASKAHQALLLTLKWTAQTLLEFALRRLL